MILFCSVKFIEGKVPSTYTKKIYQFFKSKVNIPFLF
jgi:hypothetical protein